MHTPKVVLTISDGGKSRRAPRLLLREGLVGAISHRERGHPVKPTGRVYDHASPTRLPKRGDPLRSIEAIIADVCRLRDSVPAEELQRYDLECVYGKVQGSVAMLCVQGIDASNERRAKMRGGAA